MKWHKRVSNRFRIYATRKRIRTIEQHGEELHSESRRALRIEREKLRKLEDEMGSKEG